MYDVDDDRGEIEIEPERRWQLEFRRQVDSNDSSLGYNSTIPWKI